MTTGIDNKWFSKPRLICGLMTGTSLDGIDTAIVQFNVDKDGHHIFKLIKYNTYPFPAEVKDMILSIISRQVRISEISNLHFLLADLYAKSVTDSCKSASMQVRLLDAVGVHGQTVWHKPENDGSMMFSPSSLQLGSISALAAKLKTKVAGDFRSADIALGGQGAPLVPVFDYEFLRSETENVIALNIGGIANITVLPVNSVKTDIRAFDTGPGNVLINIFMKKYYGKEFDKNGNTAKSGRLLTGFFDELKKTAFISQNPPKSTGRELFNEKFVDTILQKYHFGSLKPADIIHTLTKFTAWSIAENIRLQADPYSKIIASGGGVNNNYLIDCLKKELPDSVISLSDDHGVPADFKEAICFAYLAYLTLGGLPGNLPSVTGASRETVLGVVGGN